MEERVGGLTEGELEGVARSDWAGPADLLLALNVLYAIANRGQEQLGSCTVPRELYEFRLHLLRRASNRSKVRLWSRQSSKQEGAVDEYAAEGRCNERSQVLRGRSGAFKLDRRLSCIVESG